MRVPLIRRPVQHRNPTNGHFLDRGLRQDRLGPDGAEEGVPARGDGRRVQQGQIEFLQGARGAPGGDGGVDVFFGLRGGCRGGGGGVGEAHCERGVGVVVPVWWVGGFAEEGNAEGWYGGWFEGDWAGDGVG